LIDQPTVSPRAEIRWHTGAREELRPLFALAEDSPEQLETYLHLGRVLVALDEGSMVGHLQVVDSETAGEIELKSMAVVDQRRRSGIGRAMVERAVAESRADGARMMLVATATADTENLRFYQLQGFGCFA
jgi:GNAT superfamily N-acetyltransferase